MCGSRWCRTRRGGAEPCAGVAGLQRLLIARGSVRVSTFVRACFASGAQPAFEAAVIKEASANIGGFQHELVADAGGVAQLFAPAMH